MNLEGNRRRKRIMLLALTIVFIFCFVISFMIGKYPISPGKLISALCSSFIDTGYIEPQVKTVIFQVRLPRVIGAILIGSALSVAGAAYQGLFRNPMASPDILGASAGAGFGAALGITLSFTYIGISLNSFLFGILTVFLVYIISSRVNNPILGIILTGIMVGSLFSSATSFLKLMADPNDTLPAITYWLMGSLAAIRPEDIRFAAIPIIIGIIPLYILKWKINVLTLGEDEAQSIGINTKVIRIIVIICATLITAASVSVSGMIGWVGLVIPHLARMLVGQDYRYMLPASMLLGGSYLLIVDNIARTISTSEIPIGILTAFVGAPFFLYLILREGKKQ